MERRAEAELHPRELEQLAPKGACEHRIAVTDDGARQTVESDDVVEEDTGHRHNRVQMRERVNCAYLENLSTTVRTTDLSPTRGKPSTKSMAMSDHMDDRTSNGCSRPAG